MKYICLITLCFQCSRALWANDSTNTVKKPVPTTNTLNLNMSRVPWVQPVATNTFGERLQFNTIDRFDDLSPRSLHPFNTMGRLLSADSYEEYDRRVARIGTDLVRRSAQYGLRETVKDIPFVHSTLNQDTFFARLFRDSVGNTAEEILDSKQLLYATNDLVTLETVAGYDSALHTNALSRWRRIVDHTHLRYGLRWNYAYAAWTVGRYIDKPILFMHLRYYYSDLVLGEVLETETEFLTSMPIGDKTLCTFGISQNINPPDWDRRISFKISHRVDGSRIFMGLAIHSVPGNDRIRPIIGFERSW